MTYDPDSADLLDFTAAVPAFADGSDTPRAWLERCIETIEAREPEVKAFVTLNLDGARKSADASSERYKAGRALGPVDGMPVAIKDIWHTEDMPTQMGSPIFEGWRSDWDAAHVFWLRRGGALIVGKTVTTEFAFGDPGPTRNPWDATRTPGGSSSGSGAAIGARMVAAATGSQVRGSVMRPAAFNGAWTLKPSFGAINTLGGFPSAPSLNHLGVFAGSLADMWTTAFTISNTAGGDPGYPSLAGAAALPPAKKPARLIRLDTAGWAETPEATREVFDRWVGTIKASGVEVIGRADAPGVEALETKLAGLTPVMMDILTWEGRFPLALYAARCPEKLGERVAERVAASERMTPADYARALNFMADLRARFNALAGRADGFIALTATGAAPAGMAVGNPIFGDVSSALGCPAINIPVLAIDGMPLGVQAMGFYRTDYDLVALARWLGGTMPGAA
jgi:Asp-tRNA(Asn)/Glu-tRNA(Gln) amidotransferase A subunit family amidase